MILHRIFFVFFLSLAITLPSIQSGFGDSHNNYLLQHAMLRYFPLNHSIRSLGMGGVWVTLNQKNEGITGNPATLVINQRHTVISGNFSYETISGDLISPGFRFSNQTDDLFQGMLGVSLALPGKFGNIGFSGTISGIQTNNYINSDFDSEQISAVWGNQLNDSVSIGYGLSIFNDDEESDIVDYGMNVGHLHRIGFLAGKQDQFQFGAVGLFGFGDTDSDLAGGSHGSGDREMMGVRAGASCEISEVLLLALDLGYTDYEHNASVTYAGFSANADEDGNCLDLGVGVEYEFIDCIVGRAGFRYQHLDYNIQGDSHLKDLGYFAPTVGLSIKLSDSFSLDMGVEIRCLDETDYTIGAGFTAFF